LLELPTCKDQDFTILTLHIQLLRYVSFFRKSLLLQQFELCDVVGAQRKRGVHTTGGKTQSLTWQTVTFRWACVKRRLEIS
jgi:hypothetical protein